MPLDSVQSQEKPFADLPIRESPGDELQNFQFAFAQWIDNRVKVNLFSLLSIH